MEPSFEEYSKPNHFEFKEADRVLTKEGIPKKMTYTSSQVDIEMPPEPDPGDKGPEHIF